MSRGKLALIIGGGVGAALLLVIIALIAFFPAERIGAIAADRASTALAREVGVDRIRLKLFPVPAVSLEGVSISGDRIEANPTTRQGHVNQEIPPLASIERVEVRPRILPLLRRVVEVHSIILDRPVLTIIAPGPQPETEDEQEQGGFWDESTVSIRDFRIRDGSIVYRDTVAGSLLQIEGLDQRLSVEGEVSQGQLARLRLDGVIAVERLAADMPEALATPIRDLRVGVEHRALLDLETRSATVDQLALRVQEFTLDGSGSVVEWADPTLRRVAFRFESGSADLRQLIASLPEGLRSWPEGAADGEQLTAAGGRASVVATVDGRLGDGEIPIVDGRLTLDNVALARGGDPILTDLRGEVTFSLDGLSTPGIVGRLMGQPLQLAIDLDEPADPDVRGSLVTGIDLGRAAALGLLPAGWTASGVVPIDVSATGPLLRPEQMGLDGRIGFGGIGLTSPDWPAPVTVIAGELALTDKEAVGRGLSATLGESDVIVDFAATGWLPVALGDTLAEPQVVFDARSRFVDADVLFPTDPSEPTYAELFFARLAGNPIRGRMATEVAAEAGLSLPELPRMVLDGRFRADRIAQRGNEFRDVTARIGANAGQLVLSDVGLRVFGGAVEFAARLGASTPGTGGARTAPLEFSFQVDDVDADSFLHRFTAFRDNLDGSLLLSGAMTLRLDEHLLPDPASLSATGNLGVIGGRLANWALVERFGQQLGLARFDSIAFRDWSSNFTMLGSRIVLSESTLEGDQFGVQAAGWFDVGGALDLGATAYLSPGLTARVQGTQAAALLTASGGPDGRVPVGLRITGTRQDPTVRLDFSEAGSQIASRVREEAEAEARELARSLAERVIGVDSAGELTTPADVLDGAIQQTQDAVVGRLRGLLGGPPAAGGAPPVTPPPATAPAADTATAPVDPSGDAGGEATPEPE